MPGLFAELKRRSVFRVAMAYIVVAWLMMQVADTATSGLNLPEWVPPFVILMLALGFIPTMIFAWAFELTPDGVKRTSDIEADGSVIVHTGSKLNYVTIAAVVLGIAFVAWSRFGDNVEPPFEATTTAATANSVAVLPFVNMSGSQENEYFSDGLTETLLHMLTQVPDLQVVARTSSFAFKGQDKDIRTIAAALGVAYVLEGSVQRVGERVRITAQLVRASDGIHVWSQNYDRTLDDLFGIQDEIAAEVGGTLSRTLLGGSEQSKIAGIGTQNVDAYDLYLRALSERVGRSHDGLQLAENLLKEALARDPDFLDAKAELGDLYVEQMNSGLRPMDAALTDGIDLLEQVLAERPTDVRVRANLINAETYKYFYAGDLGILDESISQLRALIEEAPSAFAPRFVLGRILSTINRSEEALVQFDALRTLDPLNARIHFEIGQVYRGLGNRPAARESFERSLELEPLQPAIYRVLGSMSRNSGDGIGYLENALKASEVDTKDLELPGQIALYLYPLGLIDWGDHYQNRVRVIAPNSTIARVLELVRAINVGDEDASVAIARGMIEDDIDDRQVAWLRAASHLLGVAVRQGKEAEAIEFINEHAPGFSDLDSTEVSIKVRRARATLIGTWRRLLPEEEFLRQMRNAEAFFESIGRPIPEYSGAYIESLLLLGETEQAIEVALSRYFTAPITVRLGWQRYLNQPHFAELLADPRIQAEVQRFEKEYAAFADQTRRYLVDREAGR